MALQAHRRHVRFRWRGTYVPVGLAAFAGRGPHHREKTMNVHRSHPQHQRGRSPRFTLGLVATAGMALVLLAALYLAAPTANTSTLERPPATAAAGTDVLSSGTGTSNVNAAVGAGSATFHEGVDLSHLPPEPDPSAPADAAY